MVQLQILVIGQYIITALRRCTITLQFPSLQSARISRTVVQPLPDGDERPPYYLLTKVDARSTLKMLIVTQGIFHIYYLNC